MANTDNPDSGLERDTTPGVTTSINGQLDLIQEVIRSFPNPAKILDMGTGSGLAARHFAEAGWDVTATGFNMESYLHGSALPETVKVLPDVDICNAHEFADGSFDAIWLAHVLEHVSNPGLALAELRRLLKPDGWLFITVPPHKENVVGGHVNTGWTVGSLMYVLADAGFGLANGRFVQHGYNVFGMVERGPGPLPAGTLRRANGDLEILHREGRFPAGFVPKQGFKGGLKYVNWRWKRPPEQISAPRNRLAAPPPIKPMKIGFFIPWITMGRGGTENVGQMMANAMSERGHEVTIFTFDDSNSPSRWPLASEISLVHLPEAVDVPADHAMAVAVASRNLDLLVGLHMNRTMLRYVRCAHKVGLPLVLSEHIDPRFPKWVGSNSADERDIAMAGATLVHLLVNDFVGTLEPTARGKARVIPNTVPEPSALATPGATRDQYTLICVARLVPRKNVGRLIEAYARLAEEFPQWRLQVVGDGTLRDKLEEQVKTAGLADRVIFEGEQEDVYRYLAAADLFVIPSLFEGFPLTLCEALAHGLPAVGFGSCSGVKEQIEHGKTGLLCDGVDEAKELEAALRHLMADNKAREDMGAAARSRFIERFSNSTIHALWEEMFADAAQMRPSLTKPDHQKLMAVRLWEHVWGPITKDPVA